MVKIEEQGDIRWCFKAGSIEKNEMKMLEFSCSNELVKQTRSVKIELKESGNHVLVNRLAHRAMHLFHISVP
jgi:hypothetical protein